MNARPFLGNIAARGGAGPLVGLPFMYFARAIKIWATVIILGILLPRYQRTAVSRKFQITTNTWSGVAPCIWALCIIDQFPSRPTGRIILSTSDHFVVDGLG